MQSVRKFNYANHPMNLPQKGVGNLLDKSKPEMGMGGDIAKGALSGAAAGAALGPWGAAAGAAIGGVMSIFAHKAADRAAEKAAAEAETKRVEGIEDINNDASMSILRNFPTTGINRPRAGKGGKVNEILDSKDPVKKGYDAFVTDANNNADLQERARLDYYNNKLDSALYGKQYNKYRKIKGDMHGINDRIAYADSTINSGAFDKSLSTEEIQKLLGDEAFKDYSKVKGHYVNPDKVKGDTTTDPMIYGLRNSYANPIPAHSRTEIINGKPIADYYTDMLWDPSTGYKTKAKITKQYSKGGDIKIASGQSDYLAENGEVIQFDPNNKPATDKFGKLISTSADSAVIKGASHEAASGGVGMKGVCSLKQN